MKSSGITLIELTICIVILGILAAVALPMAENTIKRNNEFELKQNLMKIREAIDRYYEREHKLRPDAPDLTKYPKTLGILVHEKFLRKIPEDRITGNNEWRTLSSTDPLEAMFSDKANVYDVRSKSESTALDESYYKDW